MWFFAPSAKTVAKRLLTAIDQVVQGEMYSIGKNSRGVDWTVTAVDGVSNAADAEVTSGDPKFDLQVENELRALLRNRRHSESAFTVSGKSFKDDDDVWREISIRRSRAYV